MGLHQARLALNRLLQLGDRIIIVLLTDFELPQFNQRRSPGRMTLAPFLQ